MFALMFSLTSPPSSPSLHHVPTLYFSPLPGPLSGPSDFQVHDLEEQLALSGIQCSAQAQETKAVKEALTDATVELEVCAYVKVVCVCVCVCVWCACVCVYLTWKIEG